MKSGAEEEWLNSCRDIIKRRDVEEQKASNGGKTYAISINEDKSMSITRF